MTESQRKSDGARFFAGLLISSVGGMTFTIGLIVFMMRAGFGLFQISIIIGLSRLIPIVASTLLGDLADRTMEAEAEGMDMTGLGLTKRVRAVIAIRLAQNRPHKEAVRRAVALLALPANAAVSARTAVRTVGAIWHAAGDRSADFSWYTKRAILAAIYSTTLLYWLRDMSEDDAETLEFLDRRLAGLGRIRRIRARIDKFLDRLPRPGKLRVGDTA